MGKRFRLYNTIIIFICLFSLGASIKGGIFIDNLICPQNSLLRIVRNVNFKLAPGKFYTPEELRQRGYTLKEKTLEGIVKPEAIPEGEEYVIYEIKKDDKVVGWLWENRFLDQEKLKIRYELFVKAHARLDNILISKKNKKFIKEIDIIRHRIHLWAQLLGKVLGKIREDTISEILQKGIEFKLGLSRKAVNELSEDFLVKFEGNNIIFEKAWVKMETYEFFHDVNHPDEVEYSSKIPEVFKTIADYYTKYETCMIRYNETEELINTSQLYGGPVQLKEYHGISMLSFPKDLYPVIMNQINFLFECPYRNLDIVDWEAQYPKIMREFLTSSIRTIGSKGYNLFRMAKMGGILIPDLLILCDVKKKIYSGKKPPNFLQKF